MPKPLNTKPTGNASAHFTWAELLYLASWGVWHEPSEEEKANLKRLADKMEEVREFLGASLHVNCAIRPTCASAPGTPFNHKNYNLQVQGAKSSAHIKGLAMDFTVGGMTCDEARFLLEPVLEALHIRMERKPGSGWVHVDLMPPVKSRYFTP